MNDMEEQYLKMLEEHERRISEIEKKLDGDRVPAKTAKALSVKEFMLLKKPKDDVQRTLLIGYYLEKYGKLENFTSKELERGFSGAKEPIPENISDKIAKNIRKGHIMELPGKKDGRRSLAVTNSGEKFVENGFIE